MSLREVEIFRAHCAEILNIAGKATAGPTDDAEIDRQMAALAVPSPDAVIPGTLLEDVLKTSQALRQKIRDLTSNPSWEPCSKLLATFESDFPPVSARADFVRQEVAIRKAALLVEYMELVDHSPDDTIHQRRLAQHEKLLEGLKPGPDESLSTARDVVDQTVQNVYLEDVLHEISAKAVSIDVDPATPLAYQLTDIGLRFRRSGVDDAAARRQVACQWIIDREPLPSHDWSVTYFFTDRWRLLKAMLAVVMRSRVDPDRSRIHVTLKERGKETVLFVTRSDVASSISSTTRFFHEPSPVLSRGGRTPSTAGSYRRHRCSNPNQIVEASASFSSTYFFHSHQPRSR
jgi:hypothetical protein